MVKNIIETIEKKIGEFAVAVASHPAVTVLVFVLWWGAKILSWLGICENPFSPLGFMFIPIMGLAIFFNAIVIVKALRNGLTFKEIIVKLIRKKTRKAMLEELKINDTIRTFQALGLAKNIMVFSLLTFVTIAIIWPASTIPMFLLALIIGAKTVIEDITRIVTSFQSAK